MPRYTPRRTHREKQEADKNKMIDLGIDEFPPLPGGEPESMAVIPLMMGNDLDRYLMPPPPPPPPRPTIVSPLLPRILEEINGVNSCVVNQPEKSKSIQPTLSSSKSPAMGRPSNKIEVGNFERGKSKVVSIVNWFSEKAPSSQLNELLEWMKVTNIKSILERNETLGGLRKEEHRTKGTLENVKNDEGMRPLFAEFMQKKSVGYHRTELNPSPQAAAKHPKDVDFEIDYLKQNFLEVDNFLFDDDDEEMDYMCRLLSIKSTVKCQDCDSTDCKPVKTVMDLSTNNKSITKLFCYLSMKGTANALPLDLSKILILASGIGSLAFSCYLVARQSDIISCEWNPKFLDMQKKVIEKHGMQSRLRLENCQSPPRKITARCGIVLLGIRIWSLKEQDLVELFANLKSHVAPGTLIITYLGSTSGDEYLADTYLRPWLIQDTELELITKTDPAAYTDGLQKTTEKFKVFKYFQVYRVPLDPLVKAN